MIQETLVPIVSRTLFVMDQQGLIDMPLKVNGVEVKVTPVSPLAQAQKLQEINDVVQYMQIANQMGGLFSGFGGGPALQDRGTIPGGVGPQQVGGNSVG